MVASRGNDHGSAQIAPMGFLAVASYLAIAAVVSNALLETSDRSKDGC